MGGGVTFVPATGPVCDTELFVSTPPTDGSVVFSMGRVFAGNVATMAVTAMATIKVEHFSEQYVSQGTTGAIFVFFVRPHLHSLCGDDFRFNAFYDADL